MVLKVFIGARLSFFAIRQLPTLRLCTVYQILARRPFAGSCIGVAKLLEPKLMQPTAQCPMTPRFLTFSILIESNLTFAGQRFSFWVCSILPLPYDRKQPLLVTRNTFERLSTAFELMSRVLATYPVPAGAAPSDLPAIPS